MSIRIHITISTCLPHRDLKNRFVSAKAMYGILLLLAFWNKSNHNYYSPFKRHQMNMPNTPSAFRKYLLWLSKFRLLLPFILQTRGKRNHEGTVLGCHCNSILLNLQQKEDRSRGIELWASFLFLSHRLPLCKESHKEATAVGISMIAIRASSFPAFVVEIVRLLCITQLNLGAQLST